VQKTGVGSYPRLPLLQALKYLAAAAVGCVQWDAEVRDRALGLVEDFGRGLPMPAYKEAYESLLVGPGWWRGGGGGCVGCGVWGGVWLWVWGRAYIQSFQVFATVKESLVVVKSCSSHHPLLLPGA
jgi:hypothetical protein